MMSRRLQPGDCETQPCLDEPETKMESTPQPKHFQPGEGKSYKVGRMTMTFKTTASQDWNAYTVCEAIEPPESGAGYHRHRPTMRLSSFARGDMTFALTESC